MTLDPDALIEDHVGHLHRGRVLDLLGAGVKCPHGNWRAESPSLAFSGALVRLHSQFMEAEHNKGQETDA